MTLDNKNCKQRLMDALKSLDSIPGGNLRAQVLALIPAWDELKNIGTDLIPSNLAASARDRILYYLRQYPSTIISHKEIMIVAGISEWARRVRELRVQFGWAVMSGTTAREMQATGDISEGNGVPDCAEMKPEDYILIDTNQDREAAHRWNLANEIRRNKHGAKISILEYLRRNVGKTVTGEELRYVARNAAEWARRVRELRTEDGWPIRSKQNGRPDLAVGTYILEEDRQAPAHDRHIEDRVRREVLVKSGYCCCECGWDRKAWNADDPRYLELHHVKHHISGGKNIGENLITLCNICHDVKHRKTKFSS